MKNHTLELWQIDEGRKTLLLSDTYYVNDKDPSFQRYVFDLLRSRYNEDEILATLDGTNYAVIYPEKSSNVGFLTGLFKRFKTIRA